MFAFVSTFDSNNINPYFLLFCFNFSFWPSDHPKECYHSTGQGMESPQGEDQGIKGPQGTDQGMEFPQGTDQWMEGRLEMEQEMKGPLGRD